MMMYLTGSRNFSSNAKFRYPSIASCKYYDQTKLDWNKRLLSEIQIFDDKLMTLFDLSSNKLARITRAPRLQG